MGELLPSVTTGPTSVWVGAPGEPPPAWAGGLTIGESVTGYGPAADAIRAEVDADDAKDKLIASLREQVTALDRDWNAERDKRLRYEMTLEQIKGHARYFDHKGELNLASEALEATP